ncbi:DNA ligase 3-like isoform X2 [Antedon mediterranea]|uniref:DNA ligase 3-like isoform X2 n=1 Tax=Antedon mediterranea TaxID=105859 RepID=UPI003AF55FC6
MLLTTRAIKKISTAKTFDNIRIFLPNVWECRLTNFHKDHFITNDNDNFNNVKFIPQSLLTQLTFSKSKQFDYSSIHFKLKMANTRYSVDYARLGTSKCKRCKQGIEKKSPRIAKLVPNPFSDDGSDMKQYHHINCIFESFLKARANTKKIECTTDLEGYSDMEDQEKDIIKKHIEELCIKLSAKSPGKKKVVQAKLTSDMKVVSPTKKAAASSTGSSSRGPSSSSALASSSGAPPSSSNSSSESNYGSGGKDHPDNSFREFRKLCAKIADESSYLGKTKLVSDYLKNGSTGNGFQGNTYLLLKLLLPGVVKQVYHINSKQIAKLFSQILGTNLEEMVEDLDQGDPSETVRKFFVQSPCVTPSNKSILTLQGVDEALNKMANLTRELDQQRELTRITNCCTANDLKMYIRLIMHDVRINAGAKHILEGLAPNAHEAFKASRNLKDLVERVQRNKLASNGVPGMTKKLSVEASLMTPVLPMLAEACRSVEQAFKKCPNGIYAEIKYDGERVQVHKSGDTFQYFSRSLKQVLPHKVAHIKDYLPQACPHGDSIIVDSEILLVDNNNHILPFGTLGVHKKSAFKDATVCLFIFDCLYFNGQSLMEKPLQERRKFLKRNITPIPGRIMFSEMHELTKHEQLAGLLTEVFQEGLEGLVLKDSQSKYEPGMRHWLKVKKDYLNEGAMADSADLILLGGYYGTGNKGGIMSVFLLGVYDQHADRFLTVTKCGGIDDKMLEKLNKELPMVKISKDMSRVPKWLRVHKNLVPDFVVKDPKASPVWEIIGAEFSQSETHTGGGISIRFPRVTRMRDDKDWKSATSLNQLRELYKTSKDTSDIPTLMKTKKDEGGRLKSRMKRGKDDESAGSSGRSTPVSKPTAQEKTPKKGTPVKVESGTAKKGTPVKVESATPKKGTPVKEEEATSKKNTPIKAEKLTPKKDTLSKEENKTSKKTQNKRHMSGTPSDAPSPKKGLLDVFTGVSVYIDASHPNIKLLRRYIVAYNGDVVDEYTKSNATHHVTEDSKQNDSSLKCVSEKWIWECIRKRRLIDEDTALPTL